MKDIIAFYFGVLLSVYSGIEIANVTKNCEEFFQSCSRLSCQIKFTCKLCEDYKFCITFEIIRVPEIYFV